MEARCPSCSSVFATARTGLQYCPRCGAQVNVAETHESSAEGAVPPPSAGGLPPPTFGASPDPTSGRGGSIGGGMGGGTGGTGAPPPPPGSPELGGREPTPWERRSELGFFKGLWLTWKQSVITPETFWQKVIPQERAQDALFYGWIVAVIAGLLQGPMQALQMGAQSAQMDQMLQQMGELPPEIRRFIENIFTPMGMLLFSLISLGVTAVLYPLLLLIQAAILHLFCIIFGAAKNGFWATFRVVAYASGPSVLAAVPCVGFGAAIYMYILQGWGLVRVQETTPARATLAVIAFPVLVCCCLCGFALFAIMGAASSFRG